MRNATSKRPSQTRIANYNLYLIGTCDGWLRRHPDTRLFCDRTPARYHCTPTKFSAAKVVLSVWQHIFTFFSCPCLYTNTGTYLKLCTMLFTVDFIISRFDSLPDRLLQLYFLFKADGAPFYVHCAYYVLIRFTPPRRFTSTSLVIILRGLIIYTKFLYHWQ